MDVERDDLASRLCIARLFAPAEQSAILASYAPGLELARLWTRKEAVAKASGYRLDELLAVQLDSDGVFLGRKKWHTAHLTQLPGHAVAVACNLEINGACFRALTLDELVSKASSIFR
ncbi:phosphopantetheinyl transferase [Bradyrhizobium sp. i1.4.4]